MIGPRATRPHRCWSPGAIGKSPGRRQADRDRAGRGQSSGCPRDAGAHHSRSARGEAMLWRGHLEQSHRPTGPITGRRSEGRSVGGGACAVAGTARPGSVRSRRSATRSRRRAPRSTWPSGGSAQRRVVAPAAGRVADVLARPGETMAAGAPVVSLLPPGNIFVRFFVPEAAFRRSIAAIRWRLPATAAPPICPPRSRSFRRRPNTRRP